MKFKALFVNEEKLGDICFAQSWYEPESKNNFIPIFAHYSVEMESNGNITTILTQLNKDDLKYCESIINKLIQENEFDKKFWLSEDEQELFDLIPTVEKRYQHKPELKNIIIIDKLGHGHKLDITDKLQNII